MNMMQRLTESDVKKLSTDRNVPEALRLARAEAGGRGPEAGSASHAAAAIACAHSDRICARPSM